MIKNKLMPEQVIASTPENKEAIGQLPPVTRLQSADLLSVISGDQLVAVPLGYLENLLSNHSNVSFGDLIDSLHLSLDSCNNMYELGSWTYNDLPKLMISHEIGGLIKSKNNPNI